MHQAGDSYLGPNGVETIESVQFSAVKLRNPNFVRVLSRRYFEKLVERGTLERVASLGELWKPIDTCDTFRPVLVCTYDEDRFRSFPVTAFLCRGEWVDCYMQPLKFTPTHWMELPTGGL